MKLAVVGSRSFKDNLQARIVAQDIIRNRLFNGKITTIISGGANGPDKWAEEVAKQFNIETINLNGKHTEKVQECVEMLT